MSYSSEFNRLEQERQVIKAVRLNEELLEHLSSSLGWFLNYCEKNMITPPNLDQMKTSVNRAIDFMESLPHDQPIVNTENNSREDNSTILWVLATYWLI